MASTTTLNSSMKEIKMNPPTPFTGERKKLDNFLLEIEIYLKMNDSVYDTDEKKIMFALSYMKELQDSGNNLSGEINKQLQ